MSTQTTRRLYTSENNALGAIRLPEDLASDMIAPQTRPENRLKELSIHKFLCGGLFFVILTVGIFWYQFSEIPADSRPPIWRQLQWGFLFWLFLFLPIETFAAGLRIWVISRALQPGVSLWTCLKAEWANLGLAMLTPSQTGGGFGQIYMLSRGGLNLGTALTVSLISFLGSMVVLLFIGIHAVLIAKINHLVAFFQGALFIFFLFFALLIFALCWPTSLRFVISGICKGIQKLCGQKHSRKNIGLQQNSCIKRLANHRHNFSEKLIDLCYMHQVNIRRFFSQNKASFLWVCLLSIVFMLSRSIMAFLCLRFLGIETSGLFNTIETQLNLIFLIYFAPTPGSSGLAEGASMLMMDGAIPTGFMPYYNLLWRCSTLYLPAIAGLLFLAWTIMQDAHKVVGHRSRKIQ
ncbi:MAG: lysylphosphatidylglycerol synthase transmembrane domain-containing protein [Desulfobacterales bacterium]|jgi:hypothetical protein